VKRRHPTLRRLKKRQVSSSDLNKRLPARQGSHLKACHADLVPLLRYPPARKRLRRSGGHRPVPPLEPPSPAILSVRALPQARVPRPLTAVCPPFRGVCCPPARPVTTTVTGDHGPAHPNRQRPRQLRFSPRYAILISVEGELRVGIRTIGLSNLNTVQHTACRQNTGGFVLCARASNQRRARSGRLRVL
jgi:hypothetical protein